MVVVVAGIVRFHLSRTTRINDDCLGAGDSPSEEQQCSRALLNLTHTFVSHTKTVQGDSIVQPLCRGTNRLWFETMLSQHFQL